MKMELIDRVHDIYRQIDEALRNSPDLAGNCRACGKCCSFESYGHRLYITLPELDYLAFHIGKENIRPMKNGICTFNKNGKCSVYDYRFASCRIFCCTAVKDFQSQLTESVLIQLKRLCQDFTVPYRYMELATALSSSMFCTQNAVRKTSRHRRLSIHPPAEVCDPAGRTD